MKKLRKMLGSADAPYIIKLMSLIETQSKVTLANWSIDYSEEYILPIYKRYCPDDNRPEMTIDAARSWLRGEKKLPEVKNIILNECHQAARELENNPVAQASARAVGQAASTIHVATHSLGLAFYGAAAIVYDKIGLNADEETYDKFAEEEVNKMYDALKKVSVENDPNPAKCKWYC